MSDSVTMNELDKAVVAIQRSQAAFPDLCRALGKGNLWLLVKYHPEIENQSLELKNGMPLPFIRLKANVAEFTEVVPVYSSEARVLEGLKKKEIPPRSFLPAMIPAMQILEILGHMKLPMVLNRGCVTGEITLPPELLRDIANGKALKPLGIGGGKSEDVQLNILNPAEYPTNLVQAAFEVFRKHKNFRAAWIFTRVVQPPPERQTYYLYILMDPRDEQVFHDFNLVVQSACEDYDVSLSAANEKDSKLIANMFKQATPFYVAADYHPPK
jgi:hypothetical protein